MAKTIRLNICCLQETNFKYKNTGRLQVKRRRNIQYANTIQREERIATLISDKADYRTKEIIRATEDHSLTDIVIIDIVCSISIPTVINYIGSMYTWYDVMKMSFNVIVFPNTHNLF